MLSGGNSAIMAMAGTAAGVNVASIAVETEIGSQVVAQETGMIPSLKAAFDTTSGVDYDRIEDVAEWAGQFSHLVAGMPGLDGELTVRRAVALKEVLLDERLDHPTRAEVKRAINESLKDLGRQIKRAWRALGPACAHFSSIQEAKKKALADLETGREIIREVREQMAGEINWRRVEASPALVRKVFQRLLAIPGIAERLRQTLEEEPGESEPNV